MEIIYNKAAIDDLVALDSYISYRYHDINIGKRLLKKITATISLLEKNPNLDPKISDRFRIQSSFHYLIIAKQIVFYDIKDNTIEIIRILDSRQDYISKNPHLHSGPI